MLYNLVMIYLISGEEELFVRNKIKELIQNFKDSIFKYDAKDKNFNLNEILDSCYENSLFAEKKVILIKDPDFLLRKVDDNKLKKLYEYIQNPIYETELIFYTLNNSFNSKLKAYKEISKNAMIYKFDSYDYQNFIVYVKERISAHKLNIDNKSANYLISICKQDATLLENNLDILSLYNDKITDAVIDKLCTSSNENVALDIINAITNKDISKTIELERFLLKDDDSILGIISLLANQLRFLYYVYYLRLQGKSVKEITDITKYKSYYINKTIDTLNKISSKQILDLLSKLCNLEIKVKNDNNINEQSLFELFILNLLGKNTYESNKTLI